ncbi:hypothetical protein JYU34_012185 [Plutella xylostella]|uniref:Uncharacterized protein n=1 Tax=Plutella xylostella TaxID=51655 RepID=A0ABQ7QFT9_PLUXY|nr:hypothetical protein JYU34_012185 [Plutella xylostella]
MDASDTGYRQKSALKALVEKEVLRRCLKNELSKTGPPQATCDGEVSQVSRLVSRRTLKFFAYFKRGGAGAGALRARGAKFLTALDILGEPHINQTFRIRIARMASCDWTAPGGHVMEIVRLLGASLCGEGFLSQGEICRSLPVEIAGTLAVTDLHAHTTHRP